MIKGWARPRGRQKKRPPREVATDPIGAELLSYAVKSPAEVNRIDLDRFLVETSAEQLGSRAAPVERLLRLAMVAVRCTETEAQPEGWLALKRICDRARQIAKREVIDVLVTAANLAGACASGRDEEPHDPDPVAVRIRRDAYATVHEALSIEPDHEGAHEVLGRIAFEDPERDTADALDAFLRAGGSPLVTYYVACCQQELGRFADALATYDRVDVGAFDRMGESWRREVFLENRAFCAWRAGDLERAEVEFRALVDRWEKDLSLALDAPLVSLVAAGAGPFRDSLGPRVRRLCVHVEDRGLVKLFDTLRQEHDSR